MAAFFLRLCWVVTALMPCVAVVVLLGTLGAEGAPQQAAGAALAAALCVVPYVFTRAVEAMITIQTAKKLRS